jgi:hypothetical protein
MKLKNSSDGLIGMWAHTYDDEGDIDLQFQVVRRSGDVYLCAIYSWRDGNPTNCIAMRRDKILDLKLYESSQALNVALEHHVQQQQERLRQQAIESAGVTGCHPMLA